VSEAVLLQIIAHAAPVLTSLATLIAVLHHLRVTKDEINKRHGD
jgi:hypothetical protein